MTSDYHADGECNTRTLGLPRSAGEVRDGEPEPTGGRAKVDVGCDEHYIRRSHRLGRGEMHGIVAAEIVLVSEGTGTDREPGVNANALDMRPEALEAGDGQPQRGVTQPPLTPRPLQRCPRLRVHQD